MKKRVLTRHDRERMLNLARQGKKVGTTHQWRVMAVQLDNELNRAYNSINDIRPTIAAFVTARRMYNKSCTELDHWLDSVIS